jgi:3-dehydroquinate synthase
VRTYLARLDAPVAVHVADLRERTKTMGAVLDVCEAARAHGLGRRDPLIALGGGVCTDVVSVAAALIRRGIPYICLPTTLVGQVDAGIGLKGGVNLDDHKSYLGCFLPPSRVLIDPGFLATLPPAETRAGLAEILKVALVLDGGLFERVAVDGPTLAATGFRSPAAGGRDIIARAVTLMLDELAPNCYEDHGLERLVDFGHTFSGHLEELSGYTLRHGDAVAIDIALSCAIAVELDLLAEADLDVCLDVIRRLGLPVASPLCTVSALLEAIDATVRHRDGALNLVVPTAIGRGQFVRDAADVPTAVLAGALERIAAAAGDVTLPAASAGMVA